MPSTTVRVSQETRQALRELAEQTGEPIHKVLAKAVEAYRRQHIWRRPMPPMPHCALTLKPGGKSRKSDKPGMSPCILLQ